MIGSIAWVPGTASTLATTTTTTVSIRSHYRAAPSSIPPLASRWVKTMLTENLRLPYRVDATSSSDRAMTNLDPLIP